MPLRPRLFPLALLALLALGHGAPSRAASFGVSPIRLDFDRGTRSGVITVSNDGEQPVEVQMQAMEWFQDAEGKDGYRETGDLIFFPGRMVVAAKEERVIRVGIKVPAAEREKTYRLFIEDMPKLTVEQRARAQVAIRLRFGVPIFVRPLKEEPRAELEEAAVRQGKLGLRVSNAGNVHVYVDSIAVRGEEGRSAQGSGWYVLSGAARNFEVPLPAELCRSSRAVNVTVQAGSVKLERAVPVAPEDCAP